MLARIEVKKTLNAFITVCGDRAREEARKADGSRARGEALGPLHGVPFSVKDLTDTAGVRTTYGSALHADSVPNADAVAVARARTAGAILVGKTTTPEFGHKPFTEGPFFGRTLNPWNESVTCGGSSGGAAVAVAAGLGPLAIGTDGGGSIRIPAACCGIVGLKPTLGGIPNLQVADLFSTNACVGPMARNVADTRLLFEILAGPDRRDPYGQTVPQRRETHRPIRIGWLPTCGNIVDEEVHQDSAAAVARAEALGMRVEPVELDFVAPEEPFLVILRTTLLTRLGDLARRAPERFDPSLLATIEAGRRYTAAELCAAQNARTSCFLRFQALFEEIDVIASPTLSAPPLAVGLDPLGQIEVGGKEAGTIRGAWYPYTFPLNLTGHPALSLPCGLTASGLPLGLHLVGRWHEEHLLLDVAAALEAAIGFSARPPVAAERLRETRYA